MLIRWVSKITHAGNALKSYGIFDDYVSMAIKDQEKASEFIAKSFYKILRKNGFTDSQIINVANNLLGCLISALEGYKERVDASKDKVQKYGK